MKCSSCDNERASLKARKSALLPGIQLYMCQKCITSMLEPRWVVILSARRYGKASVKKYIRPKRYCGPDITAEEVIP